jgi:Zn-dependent peptidase ImmA (M78 family)/DNA-binding XRE family transcriptional regulator
VTDVIERIDPAVLGERLRLARTRAGFTQDDSARVIDISRTTLVAIEKGERRIRKDEFVALADYYGITSNQLLRETVVNVDLVPRFRALPQTQSSKAEAAALLLNDLAAGEVELERLLGRAGIRNYPPERPIEPGDVDQQAEEAALEFRYRLGRGLSPIKDLVPLLESEIGIRIFLRPIEERNISGMFIFDDKIGACMLLNSHHNEVRRRQSAAHECGHFVATRNRPDVDSTIIDTNSREERFAKRFGFALLMPAPAVRAAFSEFVREHGRFSPRHLVLLAARFGVANEALCRRLEDLSLLKKGTWESIKSRGFSGDFARSLIDKFGNGSADTDFREMTPRLWLLASEAYQRDLVSEGQLSQMLRLPRIEIRGILDSLDGDSIDSLSDMVAEN